MLQKVNNLARFTVPDLNYVLAVAYKTITPEIPPEVSKRCRFDLFIRIRPGIPSFFKDQQRVWTYRGDKFTDEYHKMLRNLLNLVKKNITMYDRLILQDNDKLLEERIILKIIDGIIEVNALNQYSLMLLNYPLPDFLK